MRLLPWGPLLVSSATQPRTFLGFDPVWYAQFYPEAVEWARREGMSLEAEYHRRGAQLGRSPNADFDEAWYLAQNDDLGPLIRSGRYRSGFHHYLLVGCREMRSPLARFNESWYLKCHPDVAAAVEQGVLRSGYEHYLLHGRREGRKPSPSALQIESGKTYIPAVMDPPIPNLLSLRRVPSLASQPHLNVILPSLQLTHMSGGPNTAISLVYRLAAEGVPVRLVAGNIPFTDDRESLFRHLMTVSGIQRRLGNVSMADGRDVGRPLEIGENDVFFATAWWTAQMIQHEIGRMKVPSFFYLIQDFEPGLNAWSADYSLALETYSMSIFPIFNTRVLREHFVRNQIGIFQESRAKLWMEFEPAIDRNYFHPVCKWPDRRRRLLFYARPTFAPRNLFEIGLAALGRAAKEGVLSGEPWDLLFIGEPLPATDLPNGVRIEACPWLEFPQYAELMRSSDVLLSLMLSPHPSYPPLEMAACGNVVVTNSFGCKSKNRLAEYSPNIIAADPYIGSVAEALRLAVETVRQGVSAPATPSVLPSCWDDAFAAVIPQVVRLWNELTA